MKTQAGNIYSINLNLTLTGVTEIKNNKVLYQVTTQDDLTMFVDENTLQLGYCSNNAEQVVELNKAELQSLFIRTLPQMVGKVMTINFDKQVNFNDVYDEIEKVGFKNYAKNKKIFSHKISKGENRTMKIVPLLDNNNNIKTKGIMLAVLDAEDSYAYKNIYINNLNYFITDKIYKLKTFDITTPTTVKNEIDVSIEVVD